MNGYIKDSILAKYLKNNKDYNFIAMIRSFWHAVGVKAAIQRLKDNDINIKGIVLIQDTEKGILVDKNIFADVQEIKAYNIRVSFFEKAYRIADIKRIANIKKGTTLQECFFIAFPHRPQYDLMRLVYENTSKQLCAIVIDEGLGSYMRTDYEWYKAEICASIHKERVYQRFFSKFCKEKICYKILSQCGLIKDFNLFKLDRKGVYQKNGQLESYYKEALRSNINILTRIDQYTQYQNAVVLALQGYHLEKKILQDEDLKVLEMVCLFFRRKGYSLVIKPHPREADIKRYGKLQCYIDLEQSIPLEIILEVLPVKPKCIVGITTTALITGSLFYSIPTISVMDLLDRNQVTEDLY